MDLFAIQPTYSLHSLLRPNRSLDRTDSAADRERCDVETRERQDARSKDHRALCDA